MIAAIRSEGFGVLPVLEGANEIIRIPDEERLAPAVWLDHPLEPQVEPVVQIEVRQSAVGIQIDNGPL